jgi:cytochrome c2
MSRTEIRWSIAVTGIAVLILGVAASDYAARREEQRVARIVALTHGRPERGATALARYGCGGCHTVPGIVGADGTVGPPLAGIAQRAYVAGVLRNTPTNMAAWIRNPRGIDPHSAMPDTGVREQDSRDITAYLYTLE